MIALTLLFLQQDPLSTGSTPAQLDRWCDRFAPALVSFFDSWNATSWIVHGEFVQWNTSRTSPEKTSMPFWAAKSSVGNGFRIGNGGGQMVAHGLLLLQIPQEGFRRFSCDQGGTLYVRPQFNERDEEMVRNIIPTRSWFRFLDVDLLELSVECVTDLDSVPPEVRSAKELRWNRLQSETLFLQFSSPSAPTARYFAEVVISGSGIGSWVAYRNTGIGYGSPMFATVRSSSGLDAPITWQREVPVPGGALHTIWELSTETIDLPINTLLERWAGGEVVPFLEADTVDPRPGVISNGLVALYSGPHRGVMPATSRSFLGITILVAGAGLLVFGTGVWKLTTQRRKP